MSRLQFELSAAIFSCVSLNSITVFYYKNYNTARYSYFPLGKYKYPPRCRTIGRRQLIIPGTTAIVITTIITMQTFLVSKLFQIHCCLLYESFHKSIDCLLVVMDTVKTVQDSP